MRKITASIFVISLIIWNITLNMLVGEVSWWIVVSIWLPSSVMIFTVSYLVWTSEGRAKNIQQSNARQFKEPTVDVNNATKIGLYFIKKGIADRLKAGEHLPEHEITLWGYGDLGPGNNRQRVRENDPEALIACDLLLGETS